MAVVGCGGRYLEQVQQVLGTKYRGRAGTLGALKRLSGLGGLLTTENKTDWNGSGARDLIVAVAQRSPSRLQWTDTLWGPVSSRRTGVVRRGKGRQQRKKWKSYFAAIVPVCLLTSDGVRQLVGWRGRVSPLPV